ncbi:MAG TPA: YncE family protein [Rhodanobacteraceae bacterium]
MRIHIALATMVLAASASPGLAATLAAPTITRWNIGGPGGWDYLTLDAASHRLFVTRSDRVMVLATADGSVVGTIPDTAGVHGVAFDRGNGKGFTSNGRGNSVTRFDLATLRVESVFPVSGQNPDAIVFDDASHEVWTFNGRSHDATALDPASGRIVATIPLGGKPEFAVSDGRGRIFVNDEDHATLLVIDAKRHALQATWKLDGCESPSGLAFDAAHRRLFSVCANKEMAVTDSGDGHHVASVPIGRGPDAVAYDAESRRIYSSNGADGTLTVIREQDADRFEAEATIPTQKSARTLALDSGGHRVYLAAAAFEPAPAASAGHPAQRPPMTPDSFAILAVPIGPAAPAKHTH